MGKVIHFIGDEWKPKFIIAKTLCGRHWKDIHEWTSDKYKEDVTCKKCLKKLAKVNKI